MMKLMFYPAIECGASKPERLQKVMVNSTFFTFKFQNSLHYQEILSIKVTMSEQTAVVTQTDLSGIYKKISSGKVRDLYEIDENHLLVVSTDRVSAFDVILNNVSLRFLRFCKPPLTLLIGHSVQRLPSKPSLHTLVLRPHFPHPRSANPFCQY